MELANWELNDAIDAVKQDREWENGQIDEEQIAEAQEKAAAAGSTSASTTTSSKSRNIARSGTKRLGQLYMKMKGAGQRNNHQQQQQHSYYYDQEEKRGEYNDHATSNNENGDMTYGDAVTTPKVVKVHRKPPAIATNSIVAEDRYNVSYISLRNGS